MWVALGRASHPEGTMAGVTVSWERACGLNALSPRGNKLAFQGHLSCLCAVLGLRPTSVLAFP